MLCSSSKLFSSSKAPAGFLPASLEGSPFLALVTDGFLLELNPRSNSSSLVWAFASSAFLAILSLEVSKRSLFSCFSSESWSSSTMRLSFSPKSLFLRPIEASSPPFSLLVERTLLNLSSLESTKSLSREEIWPRSPSCSTSDFFLSESSFFYKSKSSSLLSFCNLLSLLTLKSSSESSSYLLAAALASLNDF